MCLRLLVVCCVLAYGGIARADRYTLRAELDDQTHVVRGTERLVFTNESDAAIDHLVFHLYMNAFSSDATVFMRESGGQLRGVRNRSRGSIRIESMRAEGHDLLHDAERELVPHDRTQMRVRLPRMLVPGASITIDTRFVTTLPKVFARAGYAGEFHMVGQWFPKLAKLEHDGRFASFPYHGHGEFYADFATYDLTVITPHPLTVGATGHLVSTRALPHARTERVYLADRVHDVAFVASRHLHTAERTCARVNVHTIYPPGYDTAAAAHTQATCRALAWLGATYGDYPYVDLTLVVPPRGAEGASGMEYPTLFLTAGVWFDGESLGIHEATETTIHELVHQWFQGIIATNEVRHPFLDEGLTSFVTADYDTTYAPRITDLRTEALRPFSDPKKAPPPASHVSAFGTSYGAVVYVRTQMIFETVARTWGRARIRRALGRYARAHRFSHPTPRALYDAFDAEYYRGFSRDVLEPLLTKSVHVRLRTRVDADSVVAEYDGPSAIPVDVLYEAPDGERRLRRLGATRSLRFGPGCVTIDPFRKVLLDRRRTDDRVCTPDSRQRPTYTERLTAVLAAFVVGTP